MATIRIVWKSHSSDILIRKFKRVCDKITDFKNFLLKVSFVKKSPKEFFLERYKLSKYGLKYVKMQIKKNCKKEIITNTEFVIS